MEPSANLPPTIERYAALADARLPELHRTVQPALGVVKVERDDKAILGWSANVVGKPEEMDVLVAGDSVILDFGGHRAGYLSFTLKPYKHGTEPADAPCRLRLVFGEIISDVAEDFEPYDSWLSKAWLPDEIINVDYLPQRVDFARRHAFRYVKFEVIATSRRFGVKIEDAIATAVSSAPPTNPPPLSFSKAGNDLAAADKAMLQKIDEAALLTLRNCMQTVYEDGPRRDLRLWIGDLRLQALANYCTFGDLALAKRCLYLFAATPFRDDGPLSASCYEKPITLAGGQSIVDYSQLYASTLLDYVEASGDVGTGVDLFSVALKQFEISVARFDPTTAVYATETTREMGDSDTGGAYWHFIDWQPELHKLAATHCVIIFGLRSILALSERLGLPTPTIPTPFAAAPLPVDEIIDRLVSAAREHFFDTTKQTYISGPSRQISWASNAWAVLAQVPRTQEEAATALKVAYEDASSVIGNTPYLHHYLCEAFIAAGMKDYATKHLIQYWGSMIDAGAETFWEAWDPKRPTFSPYGDFHSNSFCHAWSCTPALLLRRMGYA